MLIIIVFEFIIKDIKKLIEISFAYCMHAFFKMIYKTLLYTHISGFIIRNELLCGPK